jgi:hypothetical protein
MAKQPEKKAEEKEEKKPSLQQRLNDITFKNNQIKMVQDLQSENTKLKEMMTNRSRKRSSNMPRIQGLGKLEGNLGMQFKKKGIDY